MGTAALCFASERMLIDTIMLFITLAQMPGWPTSTSLAAMIPVATAIGFALAYLVSRGYIKQTIATLRGTIETQETNLKAKNDLAVSIAAATKEMSSNCESHLVAMTKERDDYRRDLHESRSDHQAVLLENAELKLRPNLESVLNQEEVWHKQRELFYATMSESQRLILSTQEQVVSLVSAFTVRLERRDHELTLLLEKILGQLEENATRNEVAQEASATRNEHAQELIRPVEVKQPYGSRIAVDTEDSGKAKAAKQFPTTGSKPQ